MAAPHVAGAWAVLKSKFPAATVNQILDLLTTTGKPVTDTRDKAIGGGLADEVVHRASPPLCSNGQGSVFCELSGITEIADIGARRALVLLLPFGDRIRTPFVETERVPFDNLRKFRAYRIDGGFCFNRYQFP